ncbi:MAG TPA: hypothetical protein VME69_04585 [Methylocella sp.]|nr:hypothetical protein [Methylocella sp.]
MKEIDFDGNRARAFLICRIFTAMSLLRNIASDIRTGIHFAGKCSGPGPDNERHVKMVSQPVAKSFGRGFRALSDMQSQKDLWPFVNRMK